MKTTSTIDKEEVPNKERKVQTNTPTKSTTNNPRNNRKKHQPNHQTSAIKQIVEDKEEEYSTNEIILNLNIRGFRNGKEELIRFLNDVTQIREQAVILITRTLRHEMLKVQIERYRVITTTNKESKKKGLMILVSKNYKAKEKKSKKNKKLNWNQ